MNISNTQLKLLENYRDKAYIMTVLLQEHSDYYSFVSHCFNLPLIFSSSIMTVLNSSGFDSDQMRIPNIVLNASTSLILSLIGNFKFSDRVSNFNNISKKYNILTHRIEDKVINRDVEEINLETIRNIISEYDSLNESVLYPFTNRIKERVKKRFNGKKCLPNCLNCTTDLICNSPTTTKKRMSVSLLGSSNGDLVITEIPEVVVK